MEHEVVVGSLQFSPDGRFLAFTSGEWAVLIWSAEDWSLVNRIEMGSEEGYPPSLAFSPSWERLAVGSAHQVQLWPVESDELLERVSLEPIGVYSLAFSPDGRWLVNAAADKQVRIWDPS